jgi:hypothetical protein
MREETILRNMEEIRAVLGGIGRRRFLRFVREGLPAKRDGYSYTADREKVLQWWKARTEEENG